jgi:hypothetical protein
LTPLEALAQTTAIVSKLIEVGLSDDQTFPALSTGPGQIVELTIPGSHDFSIALKNISYRDIYETLDANRSYNIRMVDGGLIQMLYRFKNEQLVSHRLCYFPSPDFEAFQNDPEIYIQDPIFGDVLSKNIVPFPVRFDFNEDINLHIEIDHAKSHMTLGQYQNCRIPVSSPLTPHCFVSFILDSFYKCATKLVSPMPNTPNITFISTLTIPEQKVTHLRLMS